MKSVLLPAAILFLLVIGCAKSDEDDELIIFPITDEPLITNYSKDSLYRFGVSSTELYRTSGIDGSAGSGEHRPYYILSKNVDAGYGQTINARFSKLQLDVMGTTIVVLASAEQSDDLLLSFYDYQLDSLSSIYAPKSTYQRWDWNQFFLVSQDGSCGRYSERGKLIETLPSSGGFLFPAPRDIILDKDNFIKLFDGLVVKYNLVRKGYWLVDLNRDVAGKEDTGVNPPKIVFKRHNLSGKTLSVTIEVTHYSGQKEVITYKINVDSGKLL